MSNLRSPLQLRDDYLAGLATPGGTDFASRIERARAFYQSMLIDVANGLRSQSDAEESAIRKVTCAGYDYDATRAAILA